MVWVVGAAIVVGLVAGTVVDGSENAGPIERVGAADDHFLDDIEVGPDDLPVVPADESLLFFAVDEGAQAPVSATAFRSDHPTRPLAADEWHIDLVATFEAPDAALAAGRALDDAVGDPAAEAAWLAARGVVADGFGWVGDSAASAPFVQVLGPYLLVADLAEDQVSGDPEVYDEYRGPLVRGLEREGATVLVEGDRLGEGAITMDLTCEGESRKLRQLTQDMADLQIIQQGLQPPWLGEVLPEQRSARRTARLVQHLQSTAYLEAYEDDAEVQRRLAVLQAAAGAGAPTRRLLEQVQERMTELASELEIPALDRFGAAIDREVLAWEMGRRFAGSLGDPVQAEERRQHYGAGLTEAFRDGTFAGGVGVVGDELQVAFATWSGLVLGFPPLVDWLREEGCEEVRVAFVDFDDVRED